MIAGFTDDGYSFTSKRRSPYTYLRSPAVSLAPPEVPTYNANLKSKSFRVAKRKSYSPLEPLIQGRSVKLWMAVYIMTGPKAKPVPKLKRIPLILVPGVLIGENTDSILVSVLGAGSTLIHPKRKEGQVRLVAAGMPTSAASTLMSECHRLMTTPVVDP